MRYIANGHLVDAAAVHANDRLIMKEQLSYSWLYEYIAFMI